MKANSQLPVCIWPQVPPLPALGEPVLVRIALSCPRSVARAQLRQVTREILSAWSNQPLACDILHEANHGPKFNGLINDHPIDLSFSYTETSAWIALVLGRRVGVDAMRIQTFAELKSVAKLYFDPQSCTAIANSVSPDLLFAQTWTKLEATLKCEKSDLREWAVSQTEVETLSAEAICQSFDDIVVTVVVKNLPHICHSHSLVI